MKKKKKNSGGFADIFTIEAKLKLLDKQNEEYYPNINFSAYNTLALKQERKKLNNEEKENLKISQEAKILRSIKKKCQFIAKYFYSPNFPDSLFMELYYSNLGSYNYFHNYVMSLNTRLFFIM